MNKSIKILVLTAILSSASSCNYLELIPPDGLVRDEYWTSKEDIHAVLMGAYQKFAQIDERLFLYGELRGDMLGQGQHISSSHRQIMEGNIYPTNSLCSWGDFYQVIHYCNLVLKYTSIVIDIDPTFTEYQKSGFDAEALFLRSLAYFYLVRVFKDVPFVMEPSEEDDVDFYLPKTEEKQIIDRITSDLENAILFVQDDYGTLEENKGRATKGAILALLADIYLWDFNYEKVIEYTSRIEALAQPYVLMHAGKWFENYYPGNSLENIFEFQFNSGLGQSNSMFGYTYYVGRRFKASEKAIERLSPLQTQEIYRGSATFRLSDGTIWKYIGAAPDQETIRPSAELYDANWIVYRLADILLMKAEALSQLGNYSEALALLNEIRKRADVPVLDLANTPEAFEDAILEERAIELAFEGKRWFDLMRMGRRNDYKRKSKLIEIIVEKVPSTQRLVLASKLTDPNGWYLPILDKEIERNNELTQNPYYESYMSD